jgi:hypothetical protein
MCKKILATQVLILLIAIAATLTAASAATTPGSLAFSNTPLVQPNGNSEPAISIGPDGTVAITALPWNRPTFDDFATGLWTGPFGSTPTFQGAVDAGLTQAGKTVVGALDADVEISSTGRLHATSLLGFVNKAGNLHHPNIGVSAFTCSGPGATGCTTQIIETAGADRSWITSDGSRVWISYHDSASSSMIYVQRSNDDGLTWQKVRSPLVGQAQITGNSTYNSLHGPIVADPFTHNVYNIHVAGETGIIKGRGDNVGEPGIPGALYNNVYVSRSTNGGDSWKANLVASFPPGTHLVDVFPALTLDPTNGKVYASWSDQHTIWFSASSDQGSNWSPIVPVSAAPANTAIFPWLAAYDGTVSLVYYGTTADDQDDPSAVWNTYLAQTTDDGASFAQSLVSATPNHVGVICGEGSACNPAERTLLDLFEVAINPLDGRTAIIYTDDALMTDGAGNPLPQIVLAYQSGAPLAAGSHGLSSTSVPEPASISQLLAAVSLLTFHQRRRTTKTTIH